MALDSNTPRKTLFRTPVQVPVGTAAGSTERASDAIEALLTKFHFDQDLDLGYKVLKSDTHNQRLKKLRRKLEALPHDDWKYPSVESLIGFK